MGRRSQLCCRTEIFNDSTGCTAEQRRMLGRRWSCGGWLHQTAQRLPAAGVSACAGCGISPAHMTADTMVQHGFTAMQSPSPLGMQQGLPSHPSPSLHPYPGFSAADMAQGNTEGSLDATPKSRSSSSNRSNQTGSSVRSRRSASSSRFPEIPKWGPSW